MRIGMDARYIYDHFPGIGRYFFNLIRAMSRIEHNHTLVLLYHPTLLNTRYDLNIFRSMDTVELFPSTVHPFSLTEHLAIPHLARLLHLDVLHSPYYVKPYIGLPCASIVTIYDLIGLRMPQMISIRSRYLFHMMNWLAIRTSSHVLTISTSSRDDIFHYYHPSPHHITVTPAAADEHFVPQPPEAIQSIRATYHLPERYILYVGSNKPHKNIERLIQAWQQVCRHFSDVRLVLAGHYDSRYPEIQQIIATSGITDTIISLHNVQEHDLPALYSGAELFIFPSCYEGFGLPPLEAMASGTPVACANISSLPEVVGDAAILFYPYDVQAIAESITQLLEHPSLRASLRQQGIKRAREFSWHKTAQHTLTVYEHVVQSSKS